MEYFSEMKSEWKVNVLYLNLRFILSSKIWVTFCKDKNWWSAMEKWVSLIFAERILLVNYDQIPTLNFQHIFLESEVKFEPTDTSWALHIEHL